MIQNQIVNRKFPKSTSIPENRSQSFKTLPFQTGLCGDLKLSFTTYTEFYIINDLSCSYITFMASIHFTLIFS